MKNIYQKANKVYQSLTRLIKDEKGSVTCQDAVQIAITIPVAAICGYGGSQIGQVVGEVGGEIVESIPYLRDIAPDCAKRTGLVYDEYARGVNKKVWGTFGGILGWGASILPFIYNLPSK